MQPHRKTNKTTKSKKRHQTHLSLDSPYFRLTYSIIFFQFSNLLLISSFPSALLLLLLLLLLLHFLLFLFSILSSSTFPLSVFPPFPLSLLFFVASVLYFSYCQRKRQTDRQTDRRTDR